MRPAGGRSGRSPTRRGRSSAKTSAVESPKVGCRRTTCRTGAATASTRSPMPPTRAAATSAAKNGTSAPIVDSSSSSAASAGAVTPRDARPSRQRRGRVRRSATEARGCGNPLLEGQADEVRLPAEAGPKAAPGEVPRIERHAGRGVAVHAKPAAPRQQDQPIGQLQQDELAVEEMKAVVATADDPEREVELRGGLEAERRHSALPSADARQAHSSMLSVWGRRSPSTPHRSSATATVSREAGSSRTRPLWICLRRWRNPACTTR